MLLVAWATLTGAWLGLLLMVPALQASSIPYVVVFGVAHIVILSGLWAGLARTDLQSGSRLRVWLALAIPFTAWLAVICMVAIGGVFRVGSGSPVPALPAAILLPVLVFLPLILRSRSVARVLTATPTWWLVGLQSYRVFGGVFLVAWSRGELASLFALPAGTGDVLVGLLAVPAAYLLATGAPSGRSAAIVWNVLGLLDFAVAIGTGMLSTPGRLQLIAPDVPNTLLEAFPMVMIPAFAVPSSIVMHALSLWQLRLRRH